MGRRRIEDLTGQTFGRLIVLKQFVYGDSGKQQSCCECRCECGKVIVTKAKDLKRGFVSSCGCSRFKPIKDKKFGRLLVIDEYMDLVGGNKEHVCICICDCGNEKITTAHSLTRSNTKSCGCLSKDIFSKDYTGMRFGRLVTIERISNSRNGAYYKCICDCGNESMVLGSNLVKKSGIKSCGCLIVDTVSNDHSGKKFGRLTCLERIKNKGEFTKYKCLCDCGNTIVADAHSLVTGGIKSCGCGRIGDKNPRWRGGKTVVLFDTYGPRLEFCEEVRRNPNDYNLLQVKCTYCGRFYSPSKSSVLSRLNGLESMSYENRFYCSNDCKKNCSLYRQRMYQKINRVATSREVQPELRKMCFERDDWTCQKCDGEHNLHCHHIDPVINNPIESADLDNVITLCKSCHKIAHLKDGCKTSDLRCKG